MQKLSFKYIFILIEIISVISCAKRVNITGGLKDTLAPVLSSSSPKNGAVNFSGNEIKIYFNDPKKFLKHFLYDHLCIKFPCLC